VPITLKGNYSANLSEKHTDGHRRAAAPTRQQRLGQGTSGQGLVAMAFRHSSPDDELKDKIADLALHGYATMLEEQGAHKGRLQLLQTKIELHSPVLGRPEKLLTGESDPESKYQARFGKSLRRIR
jgi:hypothetical protein